MKKLIFIFLIAIGITACNKEEVDPGGAGNTNTGNSNAVGENYIIINGEGWVNHKISFTDTAENYSLIDVNNELSLWLFGNSDDNSVYISDLIRQSGAFSKSYTDPDRTDMAFNSDFEIWADTLQLYEGAIAGNVSRLDAVGGICEGTFSGDLFNVPLIVDGNGVHPSTDTAKITITGKFSTRLKSY